MIRNSIKRKLTITLVMSILVAILAGTFYLYSFVYSFSLKRFDSHLNNKARTLAAILDEGGEDGFSYEIDKFLPEFERKRDSEYYQVWLENGKVLQRSRTLSKFNLPRPKKTGTLKTPEYWDLILPDGEPGRAIGFHFIPSVKNVDENSKFSNQPIELVLASSKNKLHQDMLDFGIRLLIEGSIIIALIIILVPLLIRRALIPLNNLSEKVETINVNNLDIRFPEKHMPKELKPISAKLNELIDKIDSAFKREKRLTADIAHELKTPLAELKTLAEVQLKWPEKETEKQFLEEVLEVVNQMQKMVATILTQVRAEAKVNPINVSSVDIKTVILDVVKSHKKIIEDKKIHLTVLSEEKTYDIKTDPDMLNSIINNLFDNAVQYCQEGGLVTSKIEKLNGNIKISITNTNDILEPEDLKHIFEPLWRKSTSRTSRENTGLGLAIVKTFCELLDIKLEIKILDNKDFYAGLSIKKTNP